MNENTQLHVQETGRRCMNWIQLAVRRNQCKVLMNRWLIFGYHQMGIR